MKNKLGLIGVLFLILELGFFVKTYSQQKENFFDRLHHKLYLHSKVYTYLYKELWAVDTAKADSNILRKSNIIVIPYFAYSPETNFQFGGASVYSFFTHNDPITRVSAQTGSVSYTFNNQFDIELDPDFWTAYNRTHYTGTLIFKSFPLNFYGIGYNTSNNDQLILDSRQIYIDLEVEKQILKNTRIGATIIATSDNFNLQSNHVFLNKYPNLYANTGGTSLFTGFSLIYDNRDVLNFTTKGTFIRLNPSISFHGLSSLNTMGQVNFSVIQYLRMSPKTSLGLNLVANTIFGKQVPFFLLYQLGGANIERGYYQGRFRDKSIVAAQAEFKYRILQRLALGAFIGGGTTWGYEPFSWAEIKPSYGGGIHYIFSLQNQLSLRLDYALGQKLPNEPRFHGLYFALAEAF